MSVGRSVLTSPRSWFRRLSLKAKVTVACVCVLVLAGLGFGGYRALPASASGSYCMDQGASIVSQSGPNRECVGITDGSFVFDPALAGIEHEIQQENQHVTAAHPTDYVSVVMLLPISSASGSIMAVANVLEQLRGVYTAQHYANRGDVDGITPYIQLLIGNDGYQANQWPQVVGIIENAESTQHVVAVDGLGVSLSTTEAAAKHLTGADIPVFGSTITADDFDNVKNLIRVAPSNKDEIGVAVSYIQSLFTRAVLVEDQNIRDTYDSTLVSGFEKFSDATHQIVGREPYDTTYRNEEQSAAATQQAEEVVENRISQMTTDICGAQPAAVLFAGRGSDLAQLVADLANRPCLNLPITIISGDDVANLPYSQNVRQGLASGVTLDYAGISSPTEWVGGTGPAVADGRQGFATFNTVFQSLFPGAPLSDGNSMTAYDAMLTSVSAIRLTSLAQPGLGAVDSELGALQGDRTVLGASGPLSFSADYRTSTDGSNPIGKAVPIMRVGQGGDSQFVTLDWPEGQPPAY
jgi:hypothetical protein